MQHRERDTSRRATAHTNNTRGRVHKYMQSQRRPLFLYSPQQGSMQGSLSHGTRVAYRGRPQRPAQHQKGQIDEKIAFDMHPPPTAHTPYTPHSHPHPRAQLHMCCCCCCCATARGPVARPADKTISAPYENSIAPHRGAHQQPAGPPQFQHARWALGNSIADHLSGLGANLPLVPAYWRWPTCTGAAC